MNGSRAEVAASALRALDIMASFGGCRFEVPLGLEPERLELAFPDGVAVDVSRVSDADACNPSGFFVDDASRPTLATLCSGPPPSGGLCGLTVFRSGEVGVPTVTVTEVSAPPL